ncbi:FecCD family ABC transporter permease [Mycetocola zhadangensis]|uniref:Iron ABC transporter permease n=1 Tax=Mycetocola zhadangensis TaxID=1164595 RepID=A0A3L7IX25_9MICO|nr:iron chelate uptake ABC transporter family permease subunit [Mycetocola zhadangensis]RLQ82695.1 iron ABC transporter permease [Mycetocola zhadangensis]GGE99009.1 iron ABC transporter permease [Mycetocola zhadangensis]
MTATVTTTSAGISPGARRRTPRLAIGLVVTTVALVLITMLSLAVGNKYIPLPDVWNALFAPGDSYADAVIASRIPRTILGLLVGAALAVAGGVMQGLTRNPLADPGLFGVNTGAAAAIVTATALGIAGSTSVWVALPGAFLAVIVVYLIGTGRGRATPVRLVLAGVVVWSVLAAYIQAVSLSLPRVFDAYRFWVIGSLAGRDPQLILDILPFIVIGLVLALTLCGSLNALALGDDTARALGAHVGRTRILGAVATTLLCAAATAAVGPISFVGLAVPHIVRSVTGADHRWLLPYCLVAGAALLLAADIIGRILVSPAELMVGVITAFVGGPILLLAVRRMRTAA